MDHPYTLQQQINSTDYYGCISDTHNHKCILIHDTNTITYSGYKSSISHDRDMLVVGGGLIEPTFLYKIMDIGKKP